MSQDVLQTAYARAERMVGRDFLGELLLVPLVGRTANLTSVWATRGVGAFIWKHLDGVRTGADLAQLVTGEYEVDEPTALKDTAVFLEALVRVGAVEVPASALNSTAPSLALALALCLGLSAAPAWAGMMGVPTNLDATGRTTATSVDPPGWIELFGPNAAATLGDAIHQTRFFVEVTGTTLDVRVYDPGSSGARDFTGSQATNTNYLLLSPTGATIANVTIGNDSGNTDDRLVRLTASSFQVPNANGGANQSFSGLTPGLYELRVTTTSGNEGNFFGVDFRTSRIDTTPLNAFTVGQSGATPSGFLIGGNTNAGNPPGAQTPPTVVYGYVTRGCNTQVSNFDGDGALGASLQTANGLGPTALPLSGNGNQTTATVLAETTAAQNLAIDDYGLYTLAFDPGPTNGIDWRLADWLGWTNNPGNAPRNPVAPLRWYLPNEYAPVVGTPNATPPLVPVLRQAASIVSGPNPPVAGQTTRLTLTAALRNPSPLPLANVQLTLGLPAGVAYAGSQVCLLSGTPTACTDTSTGTFRRATLASVPGNATATLRFDVDVTPTASGLMSITGAPTAGSPPPTSTTFAQFASPYGTTEVLGPLCQMTVNVGGTTVITTDARLAGLALTNRGLEFTTSIQSGTQGFRAFETNDRRGANRTPLHDGLIRTDTPDSLTPIRYAVKTILPTKEFIGLEEVDGAGVTRLLTITSRTEAERAERLTKLEGLDAWQRQQREKSFGVVEAFREGRQWNRPQGLSSGAPLAIEVSQAGRVRISRSQLEAAGLARGAWPGLYYHGDPMPHVWETDAQGQLHLTFDAAPVTTKHAGADVYVLTAKEHPTPQMPLTEPDAPGTGVRVEKQTIYFARTPLGQSPWYWGLAISGIAWPPATRPGLGTFALPQAAGATGPVRVRLRAVGRSGHHHTLEAFLNGTRLGDVYVDGTESAVLEGTIDASALKATDNELTMSLTSIAPGPHVSGFGFVYLDRLDFDLPAAAPGAVPASAVRLRPYRPELPNFAGIDYLVVTHAAFASAARDFASLKSQEGFRPAVVDVAQAYDAFSSGVPEARALRALLQHVAKRSKRLRYVLLVGDDTYDPRNFSGLSTPAFVPSIDGWDNEFGRVPSENALADLDGDGLQDVAVGRLPVQTIAEAERLVSKLGGFSLNPHARAATHLVISDERGPDDDDFHTRWRMIRDAVEPSASVLPVDLASGSAAARSAVTDALDVGTTALHYFGHASPSAWSRAGTFFDAQDALATPGPGTSVAFSWSCFSQWYQYQSGPSVGEALLLAPGGAVAAVGPSGITRPDHQALFSGALYRALYVEGRPLGDAVMAARRHILSTTPEARAVAESWNLLGDPSLSFGVTPRPVLHWLSDERRKATVEELSQKTLRAPRP